MKEQTLGQVFCSAVPKEEKQPGLLINRFLQLTWYYWLNYQGCAFVIYLKTLYSLVFNMILDSEICPLLPIWNLREGETKFILTMLPFLIKKFITLLLFFVGLRAQETIIIYVWVTSVTNLNFFLPSITLQAWTLLFIVTNKLLSNTQFYTHLSWCYQETSEDKGLL